MHSIQRLCLPKSAQPFIFRTTIRPSILSSTRGRRFQPTYALNKDDDKPIKKDDDDDVKKPKEDNRRPDLMKQIKAILRHPLTGFVTRVLFNLGFVAILFRFWPPGKSFEAMQASQMHLPVATTIAPHLPTTTQAQGGDSYNLPASTSPPPTQITQVPYSQFLKHARRGEVASVVSDPDSTRILYSTKPLPSNPLDPNSPLARRIHNTIRPSTCQVPWATLEARGVTFSSTETTGWMREVAFWGFTCALILFFLNDTGRLKFLKGVGRKHDKEKSEIVTFKDVAGVDEAKEELKEIVDFLKSPDQFLKLGARPPSGVLLVGPPGTGKTLLAKAIAGEASVPFFSISGSEFVELFVGMGASRVREIFAKARKEAPSILFIDEIDAVGKSRGDSRRSFGGGNDEREQTLNQLLTEMDGFDSTVSMKDGTTSKAVIVVAATNRPEVLDPALLRPGRFDRRVAVERPDKQGRQEILNVHIAKKGLPLDPKFNSSSLAAATTGLSGADLANVVNEAAWLAGRAGLTMVGQEQFDAALLRSVAGIEKKRSILQGEEKTVVARHESGHAVVASVIHKILPQFTCPVERLSIVPRSGGALGFTYIPPKTEDRALVFLTEIKANLVVLMGGRAAEMLLSDSVSSGAVDDIRRATELAQRVVCEFGLSSTVGPLNVPSMLVRGGASTVEDIQTASLNGQSGANQPAASLSRSVEEEVRGLVNGALGAALSILKSNRLLLLSISADLERREKLGGEELKEMLNPDRFTPIAAEVESFVLNI